MSKKEKLVEMGFTPEEADRLLNGEVVKRGLFYYWLNLCGELAYALVHPSDAQRLNIPNAVGFIKL